MNEELIIQMVTPYLKGSILYYDDFDNIFSMLSKKEQYEVTNILFKYNIELSDTEADELSEIEEYDETEDKEEFEILYDNSLFEDSKEYQIKNELKYKNKVFVSNNELCRLVKMGDRQALQDLCIKNQGLVRKFAYKYSWRCKATLDDDDLIQEGFIGLMIAAKRFDPSYKTEFSTYAVEWIVQRITRYISDAGNTIRIPVHMNEKIHKIEKLDRYYDMKGLSYGERVANIALDLGISQEKVTEAFAIRNNFLQTVSLDVPIGEDEAMLLVDFLPDKDTNLEDTIDNIALAEAIKSALSTLTPREARVIELRFGLNGGDPLTLEEIGKEFNVTRERIRQIEAKALRKLRHPSRSNKYRDYLRK